ncbi:helix-turn-helix domain-containing protein [Streptomyces pinistramenti]|uniref:helix-turn-helix domain-containing protein n=1 Tax=Streptomyces pinistramenti TaxID=2884812 RepID=UPI001D091263|nr:hypothetical protein [Streptomyces pinistramenti]MCB5911968.1 hypothetical protein [Streptomyces pinistramenti]
MRPDPQLLLDVPVLTAHQQLVGEDQQWFAKTASAAYLGGHSIRAVARHSRRSYTAVRNDLVSVGTRLRAKSHRFRPDRPAAPLR